jgi:3-hydroxymyristoyl/3-hydroxydecanoyl-(acyl carrier protein) dehydratase
MDEPDANILVVPADHPVFPGHFPGRPLVPGVMLLEWVLAQIARRRGCATSALRIREAKFLAPLLPGARAELRCELSSGRCVFSIQHGAVTITRGILEWDAGD